MTWLQVANGKKRKSATSDQTLPLHCSDWMPYACNQTSSENSQSRNRVEFTASATLQLWNTEQNLQLASSQSECRTQALAISSENSQLEDKVELYRKPSSVRVRSVALIRGDNIILIGKSQSHNT